MATKKDTCGKDYFLTDDAAKVVMMGDKREAGLALRWALVDLLNRVETGDAELIDYTLRKVESPEHVERHVKTAYERFTEMYRKQDAGLSRSFWMMSALSRTSRRNESTPPSPVTRLGGRNTRRRPKLQCSKKLAR